jgi:Uma2 family endonuclease
MAVKVRKKADTDYPDSDGQPMGGTPRHVRTILEAYEVLDFWFRDDNNVFVAANMFIYYVPGDRHKHVSPDIFVVKGIPKIRVPERRNFRLWEEGKGPTPAIEVSSATTAEEDIEDKFTLYQDVLRIPEYFLFDPYLEYLPAGLAGYRRERGRYVAIKQTKGRLPSKALALHLENDHGFLRLYNPATGEYLQTIREVREELEQYRRKRVQRICLI